MFEKTAINPELVNSIEQVYALRKLAMQFFCQQRWQCLTVQTPVERARSIVALVDVLKRAERLDRVLILSIQSNTLSQIQHSFELHTAYTQVNIWQHEDQIEVADIVFITYMQFFQQFGYKELAHILNQFQLIIVNEAHDERNTIFTRKLRQDYWHWVLQIDMPETELNI